MSFDNNKIANNEIYYFGKNNKNNYSNIEIIQELYLKEESS